jgi:GT2 family glycosyltransferase
VEIEIIVVDNASPTRIGERIAKEFKGSVVVLRLPRNEFYCGAANAGAQIASAEYVGILNDDAFVAADWASTTCDVLESDSRLGSVASRVMSSRSEGLIDSLGDGLSISGLPFNRGWGRRLEAEDLVPREVFSAAGSCAVYRKSAFDEVGGFDERFVAYLDDIDLGFRLQLIGNSCMYVPESLAYHEGGGTPKSRYRSNYLMERNRRWNLIKNLPTGLWRTHRRDILGSMSTPAPLSEGSFVAPWLAAQWPTIAHIPRILRQRREIQARRRVDDDHVCSILETEFTGRCHL